MSSINCKNIHENRKVKVRVVHETVWNQGRESGTTSSTTSSGGRLALRAATPSSRQWRRAASLGARRSAGSDSGMSPAPPWSAIAQPIRLSLTADLDWWEYDPDVIYRSNFVGFLIINIIANLSHECDLIIFLSFTSLWTRAVGSRGQRSQSWIGSRLFPLRRIWWKQTCNSMLKMFLRTATITPSSEEGMYDMGK